MLQQKESHKEHVKHMEAELTSANEETLNSLKEMTKVLEGKLKEKEKQCDQLIRY